MIRTAKTRDAELLAPQVLHIFYARMGDQIINAFFERDEHDLHRKTGKNPAHRADEGPGERDIAVHQRHHAQARIGLNDLHIHAFIAKEAFAHRDVVTARWCYCGWRTKCAPSGSAPGAIRVDSDDARVKHQADQANVLGEPAAAILHSPILHNPILSTFPLPTLSNAAGQMKNP